MKVVKRVFRKRIRKTVEIIEIQIGFIPNKGRVDTTYVVGQLIEKSKKI